MATQPSLWIILASFLTGNRPYACWHQTSWAYFTTMPHFENAYCKFFHEQIPSKDERITSANNMKVPEVWENFGQTRLGGELSACDIIMHETYFLVAFASTGQLKCKNYARQSRLALHLQSDNNWHLYLSPQFLQFDSLVKTEVIRKLSKRCQKVVKK